VDTVGGIRGGGHYKTTLLGKTGLTENKNSERGKRGNVTRNQKAYYTVTNRAKDGENGDDSEMLHQKRGETVVRANEEQIMRIVGRKGEGTVSNYYEKET